MYILIKEILEDIHLLRHYYIIKIKEEEDIYILNKLEELKEDNTLDYLQFNSYEDARDFMKDSLVEETKLYSKLLSLKNDFKTKEIPYDCRFVFVYVSDVISPVPGFYRIPLREYFLVKEVYPEDIRLPFLYEFNMIITAKELVTLYNKIYQNIPEISLSKYFIKQDESIQESSNLTALCKLIHKGEFSVQEIKETFDNLDDDKINQVSTTLVETVKEVKRMKEEGVDKCHLDEYLLSQFKDIPVLLKEIPDIISFLY